jgi:microcystin-dependent protein
VTFALPNLQGRVSMGVGNGHTMGESAGEEAHTIIQSEMPTHAHLLNASSGLGNLTNPVGNYPAAATENPYATVPAANPTYLSPTTVSLTGGNQSHENRSPFLTLNFCISLVGIFPSQN